jgi:hypothetical protein
MSAANSKVRSPADTGDVRQTGWSVATRYGAALKACRRIRLDYTMPAGWWSMDGLPRPDRPIRRRLPIVRRRA